MKSTTAIFILFLLFGLNGCSDCKPDLNAWNTNRPKMEAVVHLYQNNELQFGNKNARIERIIPDNLRIKRFDSLIITNVGSRGDIKNQTFTCRFYKINGANERIEEVVFTTQTHELKELNKSNCCVNVAPNWYVRKLN